MLMFQEEILLLLKGETREFSLMSTLRVCCRPSRIESNDTKSKKLSIGLSSISIHRILFCCRPSRIESNVESNESNGSQWRNGPGQNGRHDEKDATNGRWHGHGTKTEENTCKAEVSRWCMSQRLFVKCTAYLFGCVLLLPLLFLIHAAVRF